MRLLDLFCGAGGAAMGYRQAGATLVVGVDIEPQPNYVGHMFYRMDALEALASFNLEDFDLVHASPPCQRWAVGRQRNDHPDWITPTRNLLLRCEIPFVIENVPSAPLRRDLMLCGSMFGMQVQRHRHFELEGFGVNQPECSHVWTHGRPHTVTGHADGPNGMWNNPHHLGFANLAHAQELMGMPWTKTIREVTEAIPPAYTKYIGEQFLEIGLGDLTGKAPQPPLPEGEEK